MKVGDSPLFIRPEATIVLKVLNGPRIGISIVEILNVRRRSLGRHLHFVVMLSRHN